MPRARAFAVIIGDDEANAGEATPEAAACWPASNRTNSERVSVDSVCRRNHELHFGLGRIVMATYDLEEQEQIAEIKAWWKQYGNLLAGIVTAVSIAVVAWQGWNWYQRNQTAQASMVYGVLQKAVRRERCAAHQDGEWRTAREVRRTAYAPLAALTAARVMSMPAMSRRPSCSSPGSSNMARINCAIWRACVWRPCCSTKRPTMRR
jgi:hypothetical protein